MGGDGDTFAVRLAAQIYGWARWLVDPPTAPTVLDMTPHPENDIDLLLTILEQTAFIADTPCPICNTLGGVQKTVGVSTPETVLGIELLTECQNGHDRPVDYS